MSGWENPQRWMLADWRGQSKLLDFPLEALTIWETVLVQAADLVGQLGDPLYARKANAL